MSVMTKWNELVEKMNKEEDNPLRELVFLIKEVLENPTQKGYEEVLVKFDETEPKIKELSAKMYVEMDKLIRSQMANIFDMLSKELEKKENIRKKTRWELFKEEVRRRDWKPIIEVIELIEKRENDVVTEQTVEEIQKKVNEISPYINNNLSPYDSDWADKEFNKKIRILSNKVDRVVRESFGDYIKGLRKAKNWSLKDLENRTQVTASYIHRLESGSRKTPSIPIAEKLARGLEVPVHEFLAKLKLFEGDADDVKEVLIGLPELLALNSFTINGKKASKVQKEAITNLMNEILSASWTPDTMLKEQHEIIKLVDIFKKLK